MRIGFDFSGVVINTAVTKSRVAKKLYGVDLPLENSVLNTLNGRLPEEEYRRLQDVVFGTSELLSSPPISETGRIALKRLMEKHQVFLVSCMQAPGVQFARQWLHEQELDGNAFASVGVGGSKTRVLQHSFRAYADDSPELLKELIHVVPHLFLFDAPYNRSETLHPRIIRVRDWHELTERLHEINSAEENFNRAFA